MANLISTTGGIKNDIIVKLGIDTTSAFYTDAVLDEWINTAHKWAANFKKWPMTEGRVSTTTASTSTNEDGWTVLEYPEGFKTDSIRMLTVGGKHFLKKNFYKFQEFIENNSSDTSVIYTDYARRIFINPNAAGFSGTIALWGQFMPNDLDRTDPTQGTIFTGFNDEGNLAIVQEVMSYAADRERQGVGLVRGKVAGVGPFHHNSAIDILEHLWKTITDEQFMYQDTQNEGMFKRFDITRGGFKEDVFRRDSWGL